MPYGVSWTKYLSSVTLALMFSLAGSQTVHNIYQPLADIEELIGKELDILIEQHEEKIKLGIDKKSKECSQQ